MKRVPPVPELPVCYKLSSVWRSGKPGGGEAVNSSQCCAATIAGSSAVQSHAAKTHQVYLSPTSFMRRQISIYKL